MDCNRLLSVVHLPLINPQQIASALRIHRLRCEQTTNRGALLFLCDLLDAEAQTLPEDADLIRCVQSGVMSMNARRPGKYLFLVRRRTHSAALCMWLGEHQTTPIRKAVHLLLKGLPAEPYEASNLTKGSFKDAYDAVLITHASLSMLPDTPAKMLSALSAGGYSSLRGEIVIPSRTEESLFTRFLRAGFSLLPPLALARIAPEEPLAAIYAADALDRFAPSKTAKGCVFLLDHPPTLGDLFSSASIDYVIRNERLSLLPLLQLASLLIASFMGWQWLALTALLIPEWHAVFKARQLPCALIRLVFLPRHALVVLNAILNRRFSRSQYRLLFASSSGVCPFFAAALLFFSLRSAGAVVISLIVSLLWFTAPTIDRALSLPARERIPLDEREQRQLRKLAEDSFFSLSPEAATPAHLLAACAGCMLGLLEPDEAARRAEGMIPNLKSDSVFDAACILAAAQFFTECMAQCDAALRSLPSKLEELVHLPDSPSGGALCALLYAAGKNQPSSSAADVLASAGHGETMEALFLARERMPSCDALMPITHPHTYLKRLRQLPSQDCKANKSGSPSPQEEANRFLILACSALDAPFYPLLMRAARIAPYAPLLDLSDQQTVKPASRSAATILRA